MAALLPLAQLGESASHERLVKDRSHRRAYRGGIIGIVLAAEEDGASPSRRIGSPEDRPQIAGRLDELVRDPAVAGGRPDIAKFHPALPHNGADPLSLHCHRGSEKVRRTYFTRRN